MATKTNKRQNSRRVQIDVRCAKCGGILPYAVICDSVIEVSICHSCIKDDSKKAYDRGYIRGRADGKRAVRLPDMSRDELLQRAKEYLSDGISCL